MFNCLGLKILFKGKIGSGGGIKTKTISLKCGKNSLTHKNLKIDYLNNQIKSKSGVIGMSVMLIY